MRRIAKTLLVAATLCLAAAVFAPKPSVAADKLTLMLDWFINPDHAPLFVALEKGYFADEGIEVELIAPADPNDPPKLVAAGKADLAVSYQPQLHLQVAEGLPLVRIATLVATPLNTLLVLADGPVQSIADLKGRTVGYSVGGFEDALLGAMLERHGLGIEDVTLVNVNFSLSPSLLSGQVDAVIGAYRNFELNQMDIEGHTGRAFYIEEEGFLINHPDESWQLFLRGREELDDELNKRAWRDTLPRFALRPAALDTARYERFAAFLQAQGLIPEALPASAYAVELD
ncbi:Putative thiamine biosynthesis protein HI_0357 [Geodia barretti]|uniref:Thiamine biosynthesis protein HI_0357 n=1 Tax=Geodia barretti TaxID=519541 RepID=A0AA35X4A0_GEOBA|nr:Putative thiamine biosynthesis protein HI_0357 [Geodia barretti]